VRRQVRQGESASRRSAVQGAEPLTGAEPVKGRVITCGWRRCPPPGGNAGKNSDIQKTARDAKVAYSRTPAASRASLMARRSGLRRLLARRQQSPDQPKQGNEDPDDEHDPVPLPDEMMPRVTSKMT
jgi:hypothetical protein